MLDMYVFIVRLEIKSKKYHVFIKYFTPSFVCISEGTNETLK